MPAPAAPTGLIITEVIAGSGALQLEWTHAGTDRFEILRQESGQTAWASEVVAPAVDFGSGPYFYVTVGAPTTLFAVRAINASGEVSV